MRRFGALFASALLSACATDGEVFVELPPEAGLHRTMIVVVERSTGLTVTVYDLSNSTPIHLEFPSEEDVELTALFYAEQPAALGLVAGPLESEDGAACGASPLPGALSTHRLVVSRTPAWEARPPSAAVDAFRYRGRCPCPSLGVMSTYVVPGGELVSAATQVDADHALAATGDLASLSSSLFLLGRAGAERVSATLPGRVRAIGVTRETIWIGANARLFKGTIADGFTPTATTATNLAAIDGVQDEVFITTGGGALLRYDGATLEQWFDRGTEPAGSRQFGLVLRLGPGRAVVAIQGMLGTRVFQDGELRERFDVRTETRGLIGMVELDQIGLLVVASNSEVFRTRDGEFEKLAAPEIAEPTSMIRIGPSTAVYSTEAGELQSYVVGYGFCPKVAPRGTSISALVTLEGAVLAIGRTPNTRAGFLVQVLDTEPR